MNISKICEIPPILVKGTLVEQELLQKALRAQKATFKTTLHQNYSLTEDVVCLYAFRKNDIRGLRQYLKELRRILNKTRKQRAEIVKKALNGNYNPLLDMISIHTKHHGRRIGEFVSLPKSTIPADQAIDSIASGLIKSLTRKACEKHLAN